MKIPDVNILVAAYRTDVPQHERCRVWLEGAVSAPETLGLSELVLSGAIRVLSHPRVFRVPTPVPEILARFHDLRAAPGVRLVRPGARHWGYFAQLVERAEARGNLVADAYHAALALEHGATWVTLDRDFAKFTPVRWELPS